MMLDTRFAHAVEDIKHLARSAAAGPQDTASLLKNLFSRWEGRRQQDCA